MNTTATNEKKQAALTALMECPTLTAAAQAANVDRRTLYNWLHHDADFYQEYSRQLERRAIEQHERLEGERQRAIDTITAIMTDDEQPGAVRLRAAASILAECDAARQRVEKIAADLNSPFRMF